MDRQEIKVVIMAGGYGTRIASVFSDIPKPMIEINGRSVLEWEIASLCSQGFKHIIITVSHLSNIIMEYFGDGRKFGVHIEYFNEDTPLGNAGALFHLKDRLSKNFFLLNADVIFDVDFNKFLDFHENHGGMVSILTHPNSHPYDSGLIIADDHHRVINWLSKEDVRPEWYENRVNAGLHIISLELLNQYISTPKIDLDTQLLKPLTITGQMFCYDSPEYVKDMGTPERYESVSKDLASGVVHAKNLLKKQKAIFLDRDGTINKHVGFLTNIDNFELLPNVSSAIKRINSSSYLAIVSTNQPVISRGDITFSKLKEIHNKMETLLGLDGAYLDDIYFCPHHPHCGFEGEVKELKFDCSCRKPKPGMLIKAACDFNIDLSQSWMIGDSDSDMIASEAAGCRFLKITSDFSLLDAVNYILED